MLLRAMMHLGRLSWQQRNPGSIAGSNVVPAGLPAATDCGCELPPKTFFLMWGASRGLACSAFGRLLIAVVRHLLCEPLIPFDMPTPLYLDTSLVRRHVYILSLLVLIIVHLQGSRKHWLSGLAYPQIHETPVCH